MDFIVVIKMVTHVDNINKCEVTACRYADSVMYLYFWEQPVFFVYVCVRVCSCIAEISIYKYIYV